MKKIALLLAMGCLLASCGGDGGPEYIATHEPDEVLEAYAFPHYLDWDNMVLFRQK